VAWDAARQRRARRGVTRLAWRRQQRQRAVAALVVLGLGALLWQLMRGPSPSSVTNSAPQPVPTHALSKSQVLHLPDGSTIETLDDAVLEVTQVSQDNVRVRLDKGHARFNVVSNPERRFLIQSGSLVMSVLGTRFDVEHRDDHIMVAVDEGQVRVDALHGQLTLGAGERVRFELKSSHSEHASAHPPATPLVPPTSDVADWLGPLPDRFAHRTRTTLGQLSQLIASRSVESVSHPPANAMSVTASSVPKRRVVSKPQRALWLSRADTGDIEGAAQALAREGLSSELGVDALLKAADVWRLAGRPTRARQVLETLVRRYPKDPRAYPARFSLGRLLLDKLNKPCDAAVVFATLDQSSAPASLREDALAREVMAWRACGRQERVRDRAQHYLTRYPQGHHRETLQPYANP